MSFGVLRFQAKRFATLGDGAVIVTLAVEGRAQVLMGHSTSRIEPQRLAKLGDGIVHFPLPGQDVSQVEMQRRAPRVECERGTVLGFRFFPIFLLLEARRPP